MPKILHPGQLAPRSAIYDLIGRRGGITGEQIVSTEGKPMPPTPKPGQSYRVAKSAHHRPSKR